MDLPETCAAAARALHEPLAGTAPLAQGWVAIEAPGPWGRDGLRDSGFEPTTVSALTQAAAEHGVRIQLIRRPGRRPPTQPGRRRVFLAHSGDVTWCERLLLDDRELAGLDPSVCASPTPPGRGEPHDEPVLLVCTHAKRDRCCATFGRPVADTLAALHGDHVWETSHTGGHRFAANLVVLPHGLVYGGLDVAQAVETVAYHLAGQVDAAHLRGLSRLGRPAQAAEALVRRERGLTDLDAVSVLEVAASGEDAFVARVATPSGIVVATLAHEPLSTPRRISCDADELEDPASFRLTALAADGDETSGLDG